MWRLITRCTCFTFSVSASKSEMKWQETAWNLHPSSAYQKLAYTANTDSYQKRLFCIQTPVKQKDSFATFAVQSCFLTCIWQFFSCTALESCSVHLTNSFSKVKKKHTSTQLTQAISQKCNGNDVEFWVITFSGIVNVCCTSSDFTRVVHVGLW